MPGSILVPKRPRTVPTGLIILWASGSSAAVSGCLGTHPPPRLYSPKRLPGAQGLKADDEKDSIRLFTALLAPCKAWTPARKRFATREIHGSPKTEERRCRAQMTKNSFKIVLLCSHTTTAQAQYTHQCLRNTFSLRLVGRPLESTAFPGLARAP